MSNSSLALGIKEDDLLNCMQCGTCLSVCPTYKIKQVETESPRGRLALMKAVQDGELEIEDMADTIDMCLACRACEAICPSGVKYGSILESAKEVIDAKKKYSLPVKVIRRGLMKGVLPHPKRVKLLRSGLKFYQKSGLQTVARKSKILNVLPWNMGEFEAVVPSIAPIKKKSSLDENHQKNDKPLIAFFTGCIQEAIFHRTNENTIKLLKAANFPVIIPKNQTCCGAIHAHAGERGQAIELAKKNIKMLEETDADYLVNNQGGCGAMMKEYDHLLADDPEWSERAKKFVTKVKDINEILVLVDELPELKEIKERVTYQDSCHLANVQGVKLQPRQLIKAIPGIDFVELKGANTCCGSGGTYNITHNEESMEILDAKMENVKATGATTVIVGNPGCLLQMEMGVKRAGLEGKVRVLHIVDLLAEALK